MTRSYEVFLLNSPGSSQASASSRSDLSVCKINDSFINDSLCVLKEPAPPNTREIDILFFHGFHSSDSLDVHLKTWEIQSKDGRCVWPLTWLPEEFPNARILSVSYEAILGRSSQGSFDLYNIGENLASDFMQADIGQTPNCPVVLVGHCFGGLVIKQLCLHINTRINLVRESDKIRLEAFLNRVKGMFYYGTPHNGSPCVDQAPDLHANPLLVYFKILSKKASRMNSEFSHLCTLHADWRIEGLGESLPTTQGPFRGVVVAPEACSRTGHKYRVVRADHVSITKPTSRKDSRFYALTDMLHDIVKNTEVEVLGHQCHSLPIYPMGNRAQRVQEILQENAILGIIGMGGIGKTTLAKQVYNKISKEFEYTCFLQDVKDIMGKTKLEDEVQGHFSRRGKGVAKIRWDDLMKKKTLIVLDDVDLDVQLGVLPKLDYFAGGSKIIITSRDRKILSFYKTSALYEVEFLDFDEAKKLFCSHAFDREDIPDPSTQTNHLEKNVTKVVQKCGGLPLTLEVMGRYLRDHTTNANVWNETINKLGKAEAIDGNRNDRLWASLRVSYDALQDGEQEMFRDAATIFFNSTLDRALAAWSTGIGDPESRWANLISRSMVKVSSARVSLHEQLRDLAKNLAKDEILETWLSRDGQLADSVKLLNSNEVNENTKSLSLNQPSTRLQSDSIARLKNLKYLTLLHVEHEGSGEIFPRKLSMLTWVSRYSSRRPLFPFSINRMNKLAILEVTDFDVDEGFCKALGNLNNLRILELSRLNGLDSLPENLGNLSRLKQFILRELTLPRLPESLGKLSALEELTLNRIDCLELPESVGDLSSLESLSIEYCPKLTSLPASFGPGLKSLKHLHIRSCKVLEFLPLSSFQLRGLQELSIEWCDGLKELGDSFENLSALRHLILNECNGIERLPENLHLLTSLQHFTITCHKLARLPTGILTLPRLKDLNLVVKCVTALPNDLGQLSSVLETLKIRADNLESFPNNIGQLSSLRTLDIHCDCLEKLPESLGDLCSLETLRLRSWRLKKLPDNIGRLQSMRIFYLRAESLMTLPESIGQLSSLQNFELYCDSLERLPDGLDYLPRSSLALTLEGFRFKRFPEEIGKLSSLRRLEIRNCLELESLPDTLGYSSSLREMELWGCNNLKTLPDSLGRTLSAQVALPHEDGRIEKIVEKPPSQPSATKGLRVLIHKCQYLHDSLMTSLGWVMEENRRQGRLRGGVYQRENAIVHAP